MRELDFVAFEPEDDREAFGRIPIVVGEQDALVRRAAAVTRRPAAGRLCLAATRVRQAHGETAALPDARARRLDASAMQLDNTLRERKADAEAAGRVILRGTNLREHAEHQRQVFGRDTDAIVFHARW